MDLVIGGIIFLIGMVFGGALLFFGVALGAALTRKKDSTTLFSGSE